MSEMDDIDGLGEGEGHIRRLLSGKIGLIVTGLWIFGVSAAYFVRFSFEFYYANKAGLDALLQGIAP